MDAELAASGAYSDREVSPDWMYFLKIRHKRRPAKFSLNLLNNISSVTVLLFLSIFCSPVRVAATLSPRRLFARVLERAIATLAAQIAIVGWKSRGRKQTRRCVRPLVCIKMSSHCGQMRTSALKKQLPRRVEDFNFRHSGV